MENLSDPKYRKQYLQGYAFGMHPAFAEYEDLSQCAKEYNNEAFKSGFLCGRIEYERINGRLSEGIPKILLTQKLLQEFLLLGRLGMPLEPNPNFNIHQLKVIRQYYDSGCTFYNCDGDISLYLMLAEAGIKWKLK